MMPNHDVHQINKEAHEKADLLIKKHKTISNLQAAKASFRAQFARLDDRNKCHSQSNCASELYAFDIAIERLTPDPEEVLETQAVDHLEAKNRAEGLCL